MTSQQPALKLIYLTAFTHLFGFGLLLPQLPNWWPAWAVVGFGMAWW